MFEEMIRDTWVYEEIGQERFKKGIEQGRKLGGIEELRNAILDITHERFIEIELLTKKQIETIKSPTVLRHLIVNMSKATTSKEAALAVLAISDEETKQQ